MARVRLLGAVLCGLLLAGGPWGSATAQYPPATEQECVQTRDGAGEPEGTFEPNELTIVAGEAENPQASPCFDPDSLTDILFIQSEVHLATVRTDAQGNYTTRDMGTRIPEGASSGPAQIEARGTLHGEPVTYSTAITIGDAPSALPVTGRDIGLLVLWGAGLIVLGSVLITATWRRWQAARYEASLVQPAGGPPTLAIEVEPRPPYRMAATTWEDPPEESARAGAPDEESARADLPGGKDAVPDAAPADEELTQAVPDTASSEPEAVAPDRPAPSGSPGAPSAPSAPVLLREELDLGEPDSPRVGSEPGVTSEPAAPRRSPTWEAATTWAPNGETGEVGGGDAPSVPDDADTSEIVRRLREEIQAWHRRG